MSGLRDLDGIRQRFEAEASMRGLNGVLGVASFKGVYDSLLPVQRIRLREHSGDIFDRLLERGSIISIAYAYPEEAIDAVARKWDGGYDLKLWNVYADWYHRLNTALNDTASLLAEDIGGYSIPATTTGIAKEISHVEDFYPLVVSHRVAAELSGVGWRGRNELIVNPRYSCAIRLASVVTDLPLERTPPTSEGCGGCSACLDACRFLANKERLPNYREQCRRYIVALGLDGEVCGKCIKACYRRGVYRDVFEL
ncbi:MAG: hypothetical protein PVJ38_00350 [Candidatus Bathyarchaeota archaeon]|jgi:epoxyqueuosine reductase QueG